MTRFFFDVMSRSGPMEEIPKEDIAKLFVRHGTVQSVELLDRWMKLTQNIRYFYRVTLETDKDPFVIRSMLNGKDMNNCYIRVDVRNDYNQPTHSIADGWKRGRQPLPEKELTMIERPKKPRIVEGIANMPEFDRPTQDEKEKENEKKVTEQPKEPYVVPIIDITDDRSPSPPRQRRRPDSEPQTAKFGKNNFSIRGKLAVYDTPVDTTREELCDFFGQWTKVEQHIKMDKKPGMWFLFVDEKTADHARREADGAVFNGKRLQVDYSRPKTYRKAFIEGVSKFVRIVMFDIPEDVTNSDLRKRFETFTDIGPDCQIGTDKRGKRNAYIDVVDSALQNIFNFFENSYFFGKFRPLIELCHVQKEDTERSLLSRSKASGSPVRGEPIREQRELRSPSLPTQTTNMTMTLAQQQALALERMNPSQPVTSVNSQMGDRHEQYRDRIHERNDSIAAQQQAIVYQQQHPPQGLPALPQPTVQQVAQMSVPQMQSMQPMQPQMPAPPLTFGPSSTMMGYQMPAATGGYGPQVTQQVQPSQPLPPAPSQPQMPSYGQKFDASNAGLGGNCSAVYVPAPRSQEEVDELVLERERLETITTFEQFLVESLPDDGNTLPSQVPPPSFFKMLKDRVIVKVKLQKAVRNGFVLRGSGDQID